MSESKYQAGFGVIVLGQNPQTFMIPIYSTTVLYYSATIFPFVAEHFDELGDSLQIHQSLLLVE